MTDLFETQLDRFAELMVHAGGVKKDTYVLLPYHRGAEELAARVAHHAYRAGAEFVNPLFEDQKILYAQLTKAPARSRNRFSASYKVAWEELMCAGGSVIQLRADDPSLFGGEVSKRLAAWEVAMWDARGRFESDGIGGGRAAWTLTYVPNPASAKAVFPELGEAEALAAYWDALFAMTGADREDCLEHWVEEQEKLRERALKLNALDIERLHFSSPRTNLTVGLSKRSHWTSATKETRDGRMFSANVPTCEAFATPDWRTVSGTVCATKSVLLMGEIVEGLTLAFADGVVVESDAATGLETVRHVLKTDPGASRLGEVALVGLDSPVARQNRLFCSTLFDENAACHFALGSGYAMGIEGGSSMTKEELDALGCNDSDVHEDIMISDEETHVVAHTRDGREVLLIENGHWTDKFR